MDNYNYFYRFETLKRQHDQIKAASHVMLRLLDFKGNEIQSYPFTKINNQLELLFQLSRDHFQQEEKILIPIIREMYTIHDSVSCFLQEQHDELNIKYNAIIQQIGNETTANFQKISDNILSLVHLQLEHIFIQEQGLFPLLQNFLIDKKLEGLPN